MLYLTETEKTYVISVLQKRVKFLLKKDREGCRLTSAEAMEIAQTVHLIEVMNKCQNK